MNERYLISCEGEEKETVREGNFLSLEGLKEAVEETVVDGEYIMRNRGYWSRFF